MIFNFIILIVISIFWGLGFLFVKVGEKSISPITEMTARALIAGLTLLVICLILKKDLRKPLKKFKVFIVFSILGITIPWLGIAYSEEIISSGLAAVMLSTLPIFTFLITAFITKTEQLTIYGLAGLIIALIGLVLVIGIDRIFAHSSTLIGVLIILGAFFSYAVNGIIVPMYAKNVDPFVTITYTIGFGTIIIAVLAFSFEKPTMIGLNTEALFSLIALSVISTALVFSGYYVLLKRAGPFFTSLLGYLVPVFGVIAGAVFLHEKLTILQIIGVLFVLLGVLLVNKPKLHTTN